MKIVIWTGGAFETWGPGSIINIGIGGSETAAARMADHLGQLGHDVQIVGRVVSGRYGKSGGGTVDYQPADVYVTNPNLLPKIACDVFISSRDPSALRRLNPNCRLSVLWMHDACVEDFRGDMASYDVIFCLSNWAKDLLMSHHTDVPREKFLLTRNGIETDLYLRADEDRRDPRAPVKVGTKCFYSSSPDRGLARLLDLWPRIRQVEACATLDVFYGFDNWREAARIERNHGLLHLIDYLEHRVESMAGMGVKNRGRVGQIALARAQMESTFWLYPTSFRETSCITAMEAQAAGAYSVTSRIGALPETLVYGILVGGDGVPDEEYDEIFVDSVRDAFQKPLWARQRMDDARRWALRELGWDGVARQWIELFAGRLGGS